MSKKEITYKITTGEAERRMNYSRKEELYISYHGQTSVFSDIDAIHEAMKLLGIDVYIINDKEGWKSIWRSPIIEEKEAMDKAERDKAYKEAYERLEEFNKIPPVIKEWIFGDDLVIKLTRTVGDINPPQSGTRILSWLSFEILENGVKKNNRFDPGSYISSNNRVLAKNFRNWNKYGTIGDHIEEIIPKLKEMVDTYKEFSRKWELSR